LILFMLICVAGLGGLALLVLGIVWILNRHQDVKKGKEFSYFPNPFRYFKKRKAKKQTKPLLELDDNDDDLDTILGGNDDDYD